LNFELMSALRARPFKFKKVERSEHRNSKFIIHNSKLFKPLNPEP